MILHLRKQKIPITDAVIKWWFNLASAWLERKQPIHFTNEVISAIGWPCRFTYGYYTVCEELSELCWPCHRGGWNSEWIRWISDPSNPNLAWPILKSVKMRHSLDRIFDFSVWSFQHIIKRVQDETKNSSGQLSVSGFGLNWCGSWKASLGQHDMKASHHTKIHCFNKVASYPALWVQCDVILLSICGSLFNHAIIFQFQKMTFIGYLQASDFIRRSRLIGFTFLDHLMWLWLNNSSWISSAAIYS